MQRTPMTEAVKFVSNDDEWQAFQRWLGKPKPFMLTLNGKYPDVPHELADELFGRLIAQLIAGDLLAYGCWGQRADFIEIDPMHWATLHFDIWSNELGYGDNGQVGFTAIYVVKRHVTTPVPTIQNVRQAVKRVLAEWCNANPDSQITKADMLEWVREQLGQQYLVSEHLFEDPWRSDVPIQNKYQNRPPR